LLVFMDSMAAAGMFILPTSFSCGFFSWLGQIPHFRGILCFGQRPY
jgi:hypothetical protein